jgi:4-aminobutyrate---pyruvate transaminase
MVASGIARIADTGHNLGARDAGSHFHALTKPDAHADPGATVIEPGQGGWVTDSHGKHYIGAMSGLWGIALGYGNARLADAASRPMTTLAYYPLTTEQSQPPEIN